MRLKIILFLLLITLPSTGHASLTLYDFFVGGTIKNLAKVFVKTANLPQLKAKYTKMIIKMREDKFQKYYQKFYVVYKQLPADLRHDYVFSERISKQEVIAKIDQVSKRDLMKIISKVPSEFIVKQTKHYTRPQDQMPANGQVNETFLWKRIIQKI